MSAPVVRRLVPADAPALDAFLRYGKSVLETLRDPFVRFIAAEGAVFVALAMFPVALFCDLGRAGTFESFAAATPLTHRSVWSGH
jgi:hypothetical protein